MAEEVLRPISRTYDRAEHSYPVELDLVSAVIDGLGDSGASRGAGAGGSAPAADTELGTVGSGRSSRSTGRRNRNGTNLASVLSIIETCRGDVGLTLSIPRQGLGNAAIAAVATEEQKSRYGRRWAAMAITEPEAGSDSARTLALADEGGGHRGIHAAAHRDEHPPSAHAGAPTARSFSTALGRTDRRRSASAATSVGRPAAPTG